jgi:hypothetical protein
VEKLISLSAGTDTTTLPTRKSAGLAWLLSLVLPGAGHAYLGLYWRAGLVFGFSVLGMVSLVAMVASRGRGGGLLEVLVGNLPVLWAFGFLDAYLTAEERNRGIDPSIVDNPRVAAALNLTTRGFGYFYLGERAKGIALFVVLTVAGLAASASSGRLGASLNAIVMAVGIAIAVDAYRLGRRSFLAQEAGMELPLPPPRSRVPPLVPWLLAGVTGLVLVTLFVLGIAVLLGGVQS